MARSFAGGVTTDRVRVANYAAISNLDTISIAYWYYSTGLGGGSAGRIVFKQGNFHIAVFSDTNHGFTAFRWTTDPDWGWAQIKHQWAHELLTYDFGHVDNDPVVYQNGVAISIAQGAEAVGPLNPASNAFDIGNNNLSDRAHEGMLAEIAMWNRILTPAEAMIVYGYGARYVPTGRVLYVPLGGVVGENEPNLDSPSDTGVVVGTIPWATPTSPAFRNLTDMNPAFLKAS